MKIKTLLIYGILVLTNGCHTPKHSNVLIFATNTKVAFDISYDPKIQQPNITLGFTRQEGVWMPLLANYGPGGLEPGPLTVKTIGGDGKPALDKIAPRMLYQGRDQTADRDTYSVLATFKGKGAAKASGSNEMSGSIAQFFATGLAARELAKQGGAALVSTKAQAPSDTQATAAYIMNPSTGGQVSKLNELRKKKLASDQQIGQQKYAKDSPASAYADALAAQKGDTLFDIETKPERATDLQDIIHKLEDATK